MIKRKQWLTQRLSVCAVLGAICALFISCDRSVAIEVDVLNLTDVYAPGICPLTTEDKAYTSDSFQMSMVLMSRTDQATILPETFISTIAMDTFSALQQPSTFNFQAPQNAEMIVANGFVQGEDNVNAKKPINLTDPIVSFEYTGSDPTVPDPRKKLVILLMDQSATFIGRDPQSFVTTPDTTQASDLIDYRVSFFQNITNQLNKYTPEGAPPVEVLVYKFYGTSVTPLTANAAGNPTATANVEALSLALDALKRDENDGTPLKLALKQALAVAQAQKETHQTSVFLFTDGDEGLDTTPNTGDMSSITSIGQQLAAEKVPVFTVHLQPKIKVLDADNKKTDVLKYPGRNVELQNLACLTAGEYFFLENDSFLSKDASRGPLTDMLINRLKGRWLLKVKTNFNDIDKFPALGLNQGYLLSTNLQVTLGGLNKSASMIQSTENDRRLWIYKTSTQTP